MNHAPSNGYGLGVEGVDVNNGDAIWDELVKVNNNVRMVICGHAGSETVGAARNYVINNAGNEVCELMTNYQYYTTSTYPGYMLLIEAHNSGEITFRTYSPTLDQDDPNPESSGTISTDWQ